MHEHAVHPVPEEWANRALIGAEKYRSRKWRMPINEDPCCRRLRAQTTAGDRRARPGGAEGRRSVGRDHGTGIRHTDAYTLDGLDSESIFPSVLGHEGAGIVYWNSTCIADAAAHLRAIGEPAPDELLAHISPVGWGHIAFSGDFLWDRAAAFGSGRRPLNLARQQLAA